MPNTRLVGVLALACGVALLFFVQPTGPAAARDDVPDDVRAQQNPVSLEESELRYYQRQYKGKCKRCHGADGSGSGADADRSGVPPADFTDHAYMSSRTDGELFYQIMMGGGSRCAMPAFGPESDHGWTEDKVWHMVAFVRRFAEPPPK
jgi:mono/diheme cytochrome c family protein